MVPVLGLSPIALGAGRCSSPPPVMAAPRSNGNFYAVKWKFLCESEIFRAFFFPLKRYFSPSSHHSRGICSPTTAFSMRHPLLFCLSREGSGAIPGIPGQLPAPWHTSGGGSAGCARWVVPVRELPARQWPRGETRLNPEGRPRAGAGRDGGRARPLPFRPLTHEGLETLRCGIAGPPRGLAPLCPLCTRPGPEPRGRPLRQWGVTYS